MADPVLVRFRWRGIDPTSGRTVRAVEDAPEAAVLRQRLRDRGVTILDVTPVEIRPWDPLLSAVRRAWLHRLRLMRRRAVIDLCDSLATLLFAGVTLDQALGALAATSARSGSERALLIALQRDLQAGRSPAACWSSHPGWFDRLDTAVIIAGQEAGDLAGALRQLATFRQRTASIGQRVISALAYPLFLTIAGAGVVEFLSLKTLPPLVTMIEQAHQVPPALTVTVMQIGQIVAGWWPVILPAVFIAGAGLITGLNRLPPDRGLGRLWHHQPIALVTRRARVARVALGLARLRRANLPLDESLDIMADVSADRLIRDLMLRAAVSVREGGDLSRVLAGSRIVDQEFTHLVSVGEQSGELTELLERTADRFQRAVDQATDRAVALVGPLAILLVAAAIGVVVMASILPLVQLGDLV